MPVSLAQGSNGGASNQGGNTDGGGSENAGGNQNGGGAGNNGSAGANNGSGNNTDWTSGLSEENRSLVTQKGWKSFDDVLKGYKNAESALSGRDPAKQQQQSWKRSDYSIPTPENAQQIGYSPETRDAFLDQMAQLGAAPEIAKGMHDWYVGLATKALGKQAEAKVQSTNERFDKTAAALTKAWGSENTPQFARNLEMAQRAIANLDPALMDALFETGVLVKNGKSMDVANAPIMMALSKAGAAMFAEDTIWSDKAKDANPFDDKTRDTAAQGRIIKEDPDRAETLIRALGKESEKRWAHWLNTRKKK